MLKHITSMKVTINIRYNGIKHRNGVSHLSSRVYSPNKYLSAAASRSIAESADAYFLKSHHALESLLVEVYHSFYEMSSNSMRASLSGLKAMASMSYY